MRQGLLLVVGFAMAVCSGCYAGIASMNDTPGLLYADIVAPRDAEGPIGNKEGRACSTSILGLIATGDSSITAAAAAGSINNVSTVDRQSKNILGVYAEYCTVVRGN